MGKASRHSDRVLNFLCGGFAGCFWRRVVRDLGLRPGESVLDFAAQDGKKTAWLAREVAPAGKATGVEFSPEYRKTFFRRAEKYPAMALKMARIEKGFRVSELYDRVTLLFVLHRFRHHQRILILQHAFDSLKADGMLFLLDWNEEARCRPSRLQRALLARFECPETIDFIERDWGETLEAYRFSIQWEKFYMRKKIRLICCRKSQ